MSGLSGINKYLALFSALIIITLINTSPAYAKRSPEEVFRYQKHMAQAGYSSAIYKLADMYQKGYGTPRDLVKALELYKESFKLGYSKAEARIKEVELLLQSGGQQSEKKSSKAADEQAAKAKQLQAEREKLRQERAAHERSKRQAKQLAKQAREASLAEQRRLTEELEKLRQEKEIFEKEKRRIKAQKELEKWSQQDEAFEEDD